MILVAPPRPARPEPPAPVPVGGGTGREVLALLRGDSAARPRFDPALAGGLRAWLEDAAYDVVARRGVDAAPLALGPRRVLGGVDVDVDASDATADEAVLSRDLSTRSSASRCTSARWATRWATRSARCGPTVAPRAWRRSSRPRRSCERGWRGGSSTTPPTSAPWCRVSPRAGCPAPTTAWPSPSPAAGSCCAGPSTCWSGSPGPAAPRCARWGSRPAARGCGPGGRCTISRCSRRCAAVRRRSAWPCSNRPPAASGSRTCGRSTCARSPRTSPSSSRRRLREPTGRRGAARRTWLRT